MCTILKDGRLNSIVGTALQSFLCRHLNLYVGSTKNLILSKLKAIKLRNKSHFYKIKQRVSI
jgi:hypothetical protein